MSKPAILVVDNDADMVTLLQRHLEAEGWAVTVAAEGKDACAALEREDFAVVLTDLIMEPMDGLAVLQEVQRLQPRARVVLMTAFGSLETAIDAMRHGAYDYLTKPFKLMQVSVAVRRALEEHQLREENRRLRTEVERRYSFANIVGQSRAMQAVFEQVRAVANTDATILLLGDSGTGKELVARAVHASSHRRDGPFVAVNCAAIPETLLESELFGYEKGAFTGADRKRHGLFAEARGGTLLLDEVADMPLTLQVKLLRVLQDRLVRPIGSNQELQVDLRVISATNRDLAGLIQQGKFREDLYYRLAVIPIRIPALRERPEDIQLLAEHFLARVASAANKPIEGFDQAALAWMLDHNWPGNVRELENVVERAVVLAKGPLITREDIRLDLAPGGNATGGILPSLAELESQYVRRVLEEMKGDKRAAAKILGISVRTLQRMQATARPFRGGRHLGPGLAGRGGGAEGDEDS